MTPRNITDIDNTSLIPEYRLARERAMRFLFLQHGLNKSTISPAIRERLANKQQTEDVFHFCTWIND
jgi:purine nucleoside phosphorylase